MDENTVLRAGQFDNEPALTEGFALAQPISETTFSPTLTEVAETAGVEEPATTPVIDAGNIQSPVSGTIAQAPTQRDITSGLLDMAEIPSAIADMSELDALSAREAELIRAQRGEAAFTSEMEERFDLEAREQEERDIANQIRQERARLSQDLATITAKGAEEGSLAFATGGERARRTLLSSAVIEGLSAAQQAAQGSILAAESSIQRAVEKRFAPVREELAIQQQLIQNAQATATREEKKLLEERDMALKADERRFQLESAALTADMNSVTAAINDGRITATQGARINQQLINGDRSGLAQIPPVPQKPIGGDTFLTGKEKFDAERDLSKDFEQQAGDYRSAASQIGVIRTSYQAALDANERGESINAPSQGVLVAFQKLLDPTSVVRESEYARSGEGLSVMGRLEGIVTKAVQGGAGVPAEDLNEFANLAQQFLGGYEDAVVNTAERTIRQAESVGLDIENIITSDVIDLVEERRTADIDAAPVGSIIEIGGRRFKKINDDELEEIIE